MHAGFRRETRDARPETREVVLDIAPSVAQYLPAGAWADDERREDLPGGGLRIRFTAPDDITLFRAVLQFGAAVEVIEPGGLRARVAAEAERVLELYR